MDRHNDESIRKTFAEAPHKHTWNNLGNDGLGHIKTQYPPCNFRFCQSNLQAGIVKSVLQRQRREHFKGIRYILYPNQNDVRIFPSAKILFSIPQNYIENPQP